MLLSDCSKRKNSETKNNFLDSNENFNSTTDSPSNKHNATSASSTTITTTTPNKRKRMLFNIERYEIKIIFLFCYQKGANASHVMQTIPQSVAQVSFCYLCHLILIPFHFLKKLKRIKHKKKLIKDQSFGFVCAQIYCSELACNIRNVECIA